MKTLQFASTDLSSNWTPPLPRCAPGFAARPGREMSPERSPDASAIQRQVASGQQFSLGSIPILSQAQSGSAGQIAREGIQSGGQKLPFAERIQQSFGHHDVSKITAHLGPSASRSSLALGAQAYTTSGHIAFGQTPSLHTVAHEAAHAIQQQQGISLPDGLSTPGDQHEKQADAVADRVVRGESSQDLLDQNSGPKSASTTASTGACGGSAIQRLILRFGDIERGGFLDDETEALTDKYPDEQAVTVKDKWGDRRPRNWVGIRQGAQQYGAQSSISGMPWNKHLSNMGNNEELRIVSHGNNQAKIAGYTGAKMARQLIRFGLKKRQRGDIYIHGCLAAWKPNNMAKSFIESMYEALQAAGHTNDVLGLAGIASSGSPGLNGKYEQHIESYTAEHTHTDARKAYYAYAARQSQDPAELLRLRQLMDQASTAKQAAEAAYGSRFRRRWISARRKALGQSLAQRSATQGANQNQPAQPNQQAANDP